MLICLNRHRVVHEDSKSRNRNSLSLSTSHSRRSTEASQSEAWYLNTKARLDPNEAHVAVFCGKRSRNATNTRWEYLKTSTPIKKLKFDEVFSGKIPFSELGPGMAEACRISIAFCYQSIYGSAPQERWKRDSIVYEIMWL